MSFRGARNRKPFNRRYRPNINIGEGRTVASKRRHESDDEEPYHLNKRPHYSQSYDQSGERNNYKRYQQQKSPSRSSDGSGRYSANDRLKRLRENLNEQRVNSDDSSERDRDDCAPHEHDELQNKSPPKIQNIRVQFSANNQGRSFVVTAKPASMQQRIENIRRSVSNDLEKNETEVTRIPVGTNSGKNMNNSTSTKDNSATNEAFRKASPRASQPQDLALLNVPNFSGSVPFSPIQSDMTATIYPRSPVRSSSSSNIDDSSMDWNYIEEREVLQNLQELRKETTTSERIMPQTPFQEIIAKGSSEIPKNKTILKGIYIVVDTNIFISHVDVIKDLLNIKINGVVSPIILIPWMVIQELDYIKDGRSQTKLKYKAQNAINFINDNLSLKNSRIKGQSIREAVQQNFPSTNADDGILFCCLQIAEKRNRPMLLSNDVNLRNKAVIHGIAAFSHSQIIHALDPFRNSVKESPNVNDYLEREKIKQLEVPMNKLLNTVISAELQDAYGLAWSKMKNSVTSPPWSLEDTIAIFRKYWAAVFSMHLQKQCLQTITKIDGFLKTQVKSGKINNQDVERFADLCLAICVYLRNAFSRHTPQIEDCINSVQNIADTVKS